MKNFSRSILLLICLTVLFASFVGAQEKQTLKPNQPVTFSLSSDEEKSFKIVMKEGDFAEVMWLANESLDLSFDIYDSAQKNLVRKTSSDGDSVLFIAPKDDEYIFTAKLNKSAEISGSQNISLEYKNIFKLPTGTKQKDIRKINGYDVKIMVTPSSETLILIEKNGRLLKIMKAFGGEIGGFSFGDDLSKAYTNKAKRGIALIKNTIDKTGDEVPDVMIDYYSGGAHCCFETYFINLGETVETVDTIGTGHVGIIVSGENPKGGLLFETADNGYAYWLGGFAGSPFPNVILEFRNGKLRPNFNLMKKPAPSLTVIKRKAQLAGQQLSLEAYKGQDNEDSVLYKDGVFPETVFWGEMLDLIYTGHENLAWQYLDLVWDTRKKGKEIFIKDFRNQLLESQYWQMILEDMNTNK